MKNIYYTNLKNHYNDDYKKYLIEKLEEYFKSKILHPEEKSNVSSEDMIRELQEEKMRLMEENEILKRKIDFIEKDIEGYKKRKEVDPYDEENWEE